ncbi:AglZ/HisF2 family acetamidino modification protein [Alphaproteobacteria bacterium]|nr:AglZ/HisF2 family acetamidino modification protein [Alphaproteobacteria bacterium]
MLRSRIIPCLLVQDGGLVKTHKFGSPKYVGDPINAVRIFNEKEADELMVLDIDASVRGVAPDFKLISLLANECRMPLTYGGGINNLEHASRIIDMGAEKVAISSAAIESVSILEDIASAVGAQSVVSVIDVKKREGLFSSGFNVFTHNGRTKHSISLLETVKRFEGAGVGEIVINNISLDGTMGGYDLELASIIREAVQIPVTMLGGAGSYEDIAGLIDHVGLVGAAAGSVFVFKGKYRAVLINYPEPNEKELLCQRNKL